MGKSLLVCVSTLGISGRCTLELASVRCAIGAVDTADPGYALSQCIPSTRVKIADQKGVKRPLEEATAEETKKVTATQLLASNAAVTDSDIDALLPDKAYETLSKPEKKNAAVTDADLDSILPDEPPKKNDAQPEG